MEITIGINGVRLVNGKPKTQRSEKGKSLLKFPKNYTVIDIETTDFDYYYGNIIEISAHKYNDNILKNKFTSLVFVDEPLDDRIIKLTGITDALLIDAPKITEVLRDFIEFVSDDIIVAHNANFDINFIYDALIDIGLEPLKNDFVDTLRISRRLVKDSVNHKLSTLSEYFAISSPSHRSDADCITTNDLLMKLESLAKTNPDWNKDKNRSKKSIDFTKIISEVSEIDENNYFYNKNVCFTGKMDMLTKEAAAQTIANLGAKIQNGVTSETDVLVLGNLQYQHERFGKKSSKHTKAESLIKSGVEIEILTETTFLELIEQ